MNADYFCSSAVIFKSVASCTEFVYDKPRLNWHHAIKQGNQIIHRKIVDFVNVISVSKTSAVHIKIMISAIHR